MFLGTPAEEGHTGKEYLAREGAFDGLDAAIMVHPYGEDVAEQVWLGRRVLTATYSGVSAHASAQPFMGRNALDAATLAYQGIGLLRQQLPAGGPGARDHHRGRRPPVDDPADRQDGPLRPLEVPRDPQGPQRAASRSVLRGAALMAGVEVEVDWDPHPPSLPVRGNGAAGRALGARAAGARALPAPGGGHLGDPSPPPRTSATSATGCPGIHPLIKIAHAEHRAAHRGVRRRRSVAGGRARRPRRRLRTGRAPHSTSWSTTTWPER